MPTDDSIQAAAQVFENMTDEDAAAWLAAGDYTSVAGIPLPEEASPKFAELASQLASELEVQGFGLGANPLGSVQNPVSDIGWSEERTQASSLFQHCCNGAHFKKVIITMR